MTDERSQFLLTLQYTIDAVRESEDTDVALRAVRLPRVVRHRWSRDVGESLDRHTPGPL